MPQFEYQGQVIETQLTWESQQPVLHVGDQIYRPALTELASGQYLLQNGNQREKLVVTQDGDLCQIWYQGQVYRLKRLRALQSGQTPGNQSNRITAPMTGKILQLKAQVGEAVIAHQAVVVIESMKMETAILAPQAGTVTAILCEIGQQVQNGQELMKVEPHGQE